MQVVVDSLLTTYTRAGKGKTIVLVHGWGDGAASFRGLENTLAHKFDVINVDLPGFGQSQAPMSVWGLDEYGVFLEHFLKKIGSKPYAFIGHSNGGAVLIRGLSTKKIKADKLVLLASAGIRTGNTTKRMLTKVVAKVGKVITRPLPSRYRQSLRKKLYGVVGSDMLVLPHLQETFRKTVRQDVQTDARKLDLPVLLVYGDKDTETPINDGKLFERLMPNAELVGIEGAGHYVHQEKPKEVLAALGRFL